MQDNFTETKGKSIARSLGIWHFLEKESDWSSFNRAYFKESVPCSKKWLLWLLCERNKGQVRPLWGSQCPRKSCDRAVYVCPFEGARRLASFCLFLSYRFVTYPLYLCPMFNFIPCGSELSWHFPCSRFTFSNCSHTLRKFVIVFLRKVPTFLIIQKWWFSSIL